MSTRNERSPEDMQEIAEEAGVSHVSTLLEEELARLLEIVTHDGEDEKAA
jgi:hypothetical protein